MTEVYLLQNQNGYFLNNQQEWVDGREPNRLYKTPYKDEAINSKVELTVKSAELRIRILECPTNERGIPQIPPELLPEVMPLEAEEPGGEKTEFEKAEPNGPVVSGTNSKVESGNTSANDSSACESDTTANHPNS